MIVLASTAIESEESSTNTMIIIGVTIGIVVAVFGIIVLVFIAFLAYKQQALGNEYFCYVVSPVK